MRRTGALRSLVAAAAAIAMVAGAAPATAAPDSHWVAAWGTAVQKAGTVIPNWSADGFANHSVRQIIRVTTGGLAVRVRLSNRFGTGPLGITGATIARAGTGASVRKHTVLPLTFRHRFATTVPAGKEILSDPTVLPVAPLERLAVTLYFARPTGPATQHVDAFSTSYRAAGEHLSDASGAAFTEMSASFYFLSRVDVSSIGRTKRDLVVAFGESVTDGSYSSPDAHNTYPDELAERLVAAGKPLAVLNAGMGGNRVLRDSPCFGDSALHRFEHDVLDQPRVRTVIVMQALNDIFDIPGIPFGDGTCNRPNPHLTAQQLIAGHRTLIRAAHSRGVRIIGATVTPFKGNPYGLFTDQGEAVRDALNHWILTSGEYDAVVDFAGIVADPADPDRINPAYDGNAKDHDAVHPNDAGFAAMAAAIDLEQL